MAWAVHPFHLCYVIFFHQVMDHDDVLFLFGWSPSSPNWWNASGSSSGLSSAVHRYYTKNVPAFSVGVHPALYITAPGTHPLPFPVNKETALSWSPTLPYTWIMIFYMIYSTSFHLHLLLLFINFFPPFCHLHLKTGLSCLWWHLAWSLLSSSHGKHLKWYVVYAWALGLKTRCLGLEFQLCCFISGNSVLASFKLHCMHWSKCCRLQHQAATQHSESPAQEVLLYLLASLSLFSHLQWCWKWWGQVIDNLSPACTLFHCPWQACTSIISLYNCQKNSDKFLKF